MASGLYTEAAGDPQPELYTGGAAAAERSALNTIDSAPGARFVYAGSDTILSVRAVRQAVNDDNRFWAFPFEEILWKTGMTRTDPETDWNGDFMMSGQCWSTARDFGRFGLLYINDGVWNRRAHSSRGLGEVRRHAVSGQSGVRRPVLGLRRAQRPSRGCLQPERRRRPVRHDRPLEGRHRRPPRDRPRTGVQHHAVLGRCHRGAGLVRVNRLCDLRVFCGDRRLRNSAS